MPSIALLDWTSGRADGLDNLHQIHSTLTGGRKGRQWATAQLNQALITRLAAEFQGFARDLHDEAITCILNHVASDADSAQILRANFEHGRFVDSGNANAGNLGNDFGRLGMSLWGEIKTAYPVRGPRWNTSLTRLNAARNAIAHNNPTQIALVSREQPLTLRTATQWRSALNGLASAMDKVVGAYLKTLTGNAPW
jgi:hypothetical protein